MKVLFIGEKRSKTAIERGWTWDDGRLAGRTLRDAVKPLGFSRHDFMCLNILEDTGTLSLLNLKTIRAFHANGHSVIVAMGQVAHSHLLRQQVPHTTIIHPAARGKIRKREVYHAHVRSILAPLLGLAEV